MYQLDTHEQGNELLRCIKTYVSNTNTIRRLSTVDVTELNTPSDYVNILRDNFVQIREIADRNRQILDLVLHPLLDSDDELTPDEIDALYTFKDILLNAYSIENLDLSLSQSLVDRMFKDAQKKEDINYLIAQLDAQIEIYYTLAAYAGRMNCDDTLTREYVKRAMKSFDKFKDLIDRQRFSSLESEESRATVMTNVRYMTAIFESIRGDDEINELVVRQYEEVIGIMNDPFYRELLPDYDWKYSESRILEYFSTISECLNRRGFNLEQLRKAKKYSEILMDKWYEDPDYYGKLITEGEVKLSVARNRYLCGELTVVKYKQQLENIYATRDTNSYSIGSIFMNLLVPCEILCLFKNINMSIQDENFLLQIYHNVISYAHHCSNANVLTTFLNYYMRILENFIEVSEEFTFETMCLESFAALHPPTYIHSLMVAKLARTIANSMLEHNPGLFEGIESTGSVKDVINRKKEIASRVYHAALVHDIGKLSMIDTVFIYGRRLTDDEFRIISKHPEMGYKLAEGTSLDTYKYIIRAHHKFCDGTKGYPDSCEVFPACDKIIVDIITVADCLDAATDSVGRSYAVGKSFEEFIKELNAERGTRYSEAIVDAFKDDELRKNLRYLLGEGRSQTYAEAYHLLVGVSAKGVKSDHDYNAEDELKAFLKKKSMYDTVLAILDYDRTVNAPENGINAINDAIASFSATLNSMLISQETEAMIRRLGREKLPDALEKSRERLLREINEKRRVPEDFYKEYILECINCREYWQIAKKQNDYRIMASHLDKVIKQTRMLYEYAYPDKNVYEKMLEKNEAGITLASLKMIFAEIKAGILDILEQKKDSERKKFELTGTFAIEGQRKVNELLMDYVGFDRDSGRMDECEDLFVSRVSCKDVRYTNKYIEEDPLYAIFNTLHGCGHSMFAQNVDPEYDDTLLMDLTSSMGLHESLGRFYDDIIGRNINFWRPIYGQVQEMMHELKDVSLDDFVAALNCENRTTMRLDADELTSCLHIILRFEIEYAIFNDGVSAYELKELWNEKSKELLGIVPKSDIEGILQDIHWSEGFFGYFPSYLLGSVYAAMLLEAVEKDLGDIEAVLAEGRILDIKEWMKSHVFKHGSYYSAVELYEMLAGKSINADSLLNYFRRKYLG